MKNVIKYVSLVVLAVALLISLVGCGQDTIIATMTESNETIGDCGVRMEIMFDGDVISTIKIQMDFDKEGIANSVVSGGEQIGVEFTQEGNSVYAELDAEEYKKTSGEDFSKMSRDEIIKQLEAEGYTIVEE